MNFLLGLLIIIIGALVVIKAEAMLNNFGRIEFFEKHLGAEGGSRLGYKIIGLIAVFIGMLVMTELIGSFLSWLLAPLLKFNKP